MENKLVVGNGQRLEVRRVWLGESGHGYNETA